ncbi:hypothetical protein ADS79_03260 [Brevibacillus reuszeri]|uniref:Uncharacterized protein n=1 Tax=Brevibacillus reuszeri TaxID=54915 RepID=A0A0K9Z160_9BACL|nr:hypothetical protein ADS79_03260 [Brevibacillus reuszeri]
MQHEKYACNSSSYLSPPIKATSKVAASMIRSLSFYKINNNVKTMKEMSTLEEIMEPNTARNGRQVRIIQKARIIRSAFPCRV